MSDDTTRTTRRRSVHAEPEAEEDPGSPYEQPIRRSRGGIEEPSPDEFIDPETGKPYTRRSRKDVGGFNKFDVPAKFKRRGWDYQWFTMKVLNEQIDSGNLVEIADGGWRAVRPKDMPGFMPSDYDGATIDREGQRLYTRPEHLSAEARAEAADHARRVRAEKFAQAQMQDPTHAPRLPSKLNSDYAPLPGSDQEVQEV